MIWACAKSINSRNKSCNRCSRLSVEMDESFCVHLVVPKEKTKYEKGTIGRRIDGGDSCWSLLVSASPAFAVKQFYDELKEVYVNKGTLMQAQLQKQNATSVMKEK